MWPNRWVRKGLQDQVCVMWGFGGWEGHVIVNIVLMAEDLTDSVDKFLVPSELFLLCLCKDIV